MRKSLNLLAAASLLAALGACNRQPAGVTPDDERELNEATGMNDENTFIDTSADDQALNAEDVAEDNEANAAPAAAPGNAAANRQPPTGNRQ
ncbi:MAG TPA: hypothetical protein VMS43_00500 [Allosphingosinicella sp.]|nr:hypothetical protein [Allosphingosinicella sp.]